MLVTRNPATLLGKLFLCVTVLLADPKFEGDEVAIGSPSFDHIIVNGGSPFSITHATCARTPSDRSLLKLKGAMLGGTAIITIYS